MFTIVSIPGVRLLPYHSAVLLLLPGNDCGAHSFLGKTNQPTGDQSQVSMTGRSGIACTGCREVNKRSTPLEKKHHVESAFTHTSVRHFMSPQLSF